MKLADLPTPCLVVDRRILLRNIAAMDRAAARHGVALRPHMKTAKSIDVARLALNSAEAGPAAGRPGRGIAVSTLAEAEYFLGHDVTDILYAVGITPGKLEQVAKLNAAGAQMIVVTDDPGCASAIANFAAPMRVLIEVDCGEGRGGLDPEDPALLDIAARLGPRLAGVMTHGGHSYAGRSLSDMELVAEDERAAVVRAAERLAEAGHRVSMVSMGSTPTALHAAGLAGITELRAGVYMFGDLFQAQIGTHGDGDIALTVLASVIGGRKPQPGATAGRLLLDAGAVALSKDRGTAAVRNDLGYGLMLDILGQASFGRAVVTAVWQEQALVELDPAAAPQPLGVGSKVRILPNHACLTAAAHDRFFVVEGSDEVVAVWPKVSGW